MIFLLFLLLNRNIFASVLIDFRAVSLKGLYMKIPLFASFIVFCVWLGYEIRKHNRLEEKSSQDFWEKEAMANNTRRKSLDSLDYIQIPFDRLPMDCLADDPAVMEFQETLHTLSEAPIVNLTGISNTDLKLQYGAPNIDLLSRYDQSYTILVRTLQSWAALLYEQGYHQQAQAILEFAVETRTDVSTTYILLASLYYENGQPEQIDRLISIAENLNTALSGHIVSTLKNTLNSLPM